MTAGGHEAGHMIGTRNAIGHAVVVETEMTAGVNGKTNDIQGAALKTFHLNLLLDRFVLRRF